VLIPLPKKGQLLMVNVLIELHLNVFAQDVSGRTPRQVAQESEHLLTSACMQLLHKAEAAARARMEADLGREAPEEDALQPYSVSVARRVVAAGHTLDLTIRAPVTHSDADFLQVYVPAFEGSWNLRARMGSYVIVPQGSPVKVAMPIGTVPAGSTLRVLYMRSDLEMAVAASDLIAVVDPVLLGAADDSDSLFPWPSSSAKGDSSNGGSLSKMRRAKFPWTIGPMEVPDMELLLKTNRLLEIKLAALLKDRKAFVVGATAFKDKHPELFAPITSDSSLGKEPEAPVSAPVVASDASPAAAPGPASAPATVLVNDPLADAYPDLANIALEELPYLDKVRSKLVPTFVSDQLFWLHLLHHINDVKETIIRVATTAVKSPTAKSKSNVPPPIPAPVIAAPLASNATATAPIVTAAAAKATVSEPQPQQHPEPEPAPQKIIPLDQLSTADIVALVKEDRVKAISFEWQNNLDEALELLSTYPNLDALRFKVSPVMNAQLSNDFKISARPGPHQ